jgi:shikimate kinase
MEKKENIVLIGMPGCGKSTIGVPLAAALGMEFVDGDDLICQREGGALQEILDRQGLEQFLLTEEATMLEVDRGGLVLATGGSVPLSEKAMDHLAKRGIFVYIDVPLEELSRRITNLHSRGIAFAPGQTLADIFDIRTPIYRRWADITLTPSTADGDEEASANRTVADILEKLKIF